MKKYTVTLTKRAVKALNKLDRPTKALLYTWIKSNLDGCDDPRFSGKALSGNLKGIWRYRVGDYRIIAEIKDDEVVIMIVNIGHRREIYR
jgi:mRNA interferase RelE/StbE